MSGALDWNARLFLISTSINSIGRNTTGFGNRIWRAKEELGISYLRYALPWHKIEPSPGNFDFSQADERIDECNRLGITLLLDVMHFGTPLWLKQAVGDPEFPEALERFTTAMVTRYRDRIHNWCPFNEPLVSALFSGDFGFWPPHAESGADICRC